MGQERVPQSRQMVDLYRFRKEIIKDLDVQDVLPELLSKLVIDYRDKQLIDYEVYYWIIEFAINTLYALSK